MDTRSANPIRITPALLLPLFLLLAHCGNNVARPPAPFDSNRLMADVRALAADSMEGRGMGTPGGARARAYIVRTFGEIGLEKPGGAYEHAIDPFRFGERSITGVNVIGSVTGTEYPAKTIVVSAHYDHLPVMGKSIFNGADDNASGVAAMMAFARYFKAHPPKHSIIFAAFDGEEIDLLGSRHFVTQPPVERSMIIANINMDMIGRDDHGPIYAAGTHYTPTLKPYIERASKTTSVAVKFGHDVPGGALDDWTELSDHEAFHKAGIPFIYFGVEDHGDYHKPTDDVEKIDVEFLIGSTSLILQTIVNIDEGMK